MSRITQDSITCPKCSRASTWPVYHSVNVQLDPMLKKEVLDQTLNHFVCPGCKYDAQIDVPVLYHDLDKGLMIQLASDEFDTSQLDAALSATGGQTREALLAMKTRLVRSGNALVEKILLFDAGLDDYAFEWLKLTIQYQQPETQGYRLFFHALKPKTILLTAFKGDEPFSTEIPRQAYAQAQAALKDLGFHGESQRWAEVDLKHMVELANKLSELRERE